MKATKSAKELA